MNTAIEKKILKALSIYTPLILLGIQSIIVAVLLFQDKPNFDAITKFFIGMGIELIWFLIGKSLDDDNAQEALSAELKEIRQSIHFFNNASVEVLETYNDFYSKLAKSRLAAKKKMLLVALDPCPPFSYGDDGARKSYFDQEISYYKAHPNVNVYRIINIETPEKLEHVRFLIEETRDLPNVFLAYVKIGAIETSVPFPKMLSLQIFDNEEVFFLNPQYNYMPRAYRPCYYLKSTSVAQIYVEYYERIWSVLCERPEHGCVLKDGNDVSGYDEKLKQIKIERGWE